MNVYTDNLDLLQVRGWLVEAIQSACVHGRSRLHGSYLRIKAVSLMIDVHVHKHACCMETSFFNTEQCLEARNGNSLPSFQNYEHVNHDRNLIHEHGQAIIPSYEFTCCGAITEWGVDVHHGRQGDERYTIDFQIWRPSPTTPQDDSLGTGYYSLAGHNRFSSISLSDGVAQVTPSPQDYIQFRPGDVLGFYVVEATGSGPVEGVVVLTTPNSFTREVVWHASVAPGDVGGCVSAGSGGNMNTLLRGAPVISISTCKLTKG